jgi:hypothetical protein
MTKEQLRDLLQADVLVEAGPDLGDKLDAVCACDMMSELLTMVSESEVPLRSIILLTHLNNAQVVRTADMADIRVAIFLRSKRAAPDTIRIARECGVTIMSTPLSMFECCGLLFGRELKDAGAKYIGL